MRRDRRGDGERYGDDRSMLRVEVYGRPCSALATIPVSLSRDPPLWLIRGICRVDICYVVQP